MNHVELTIADLTAARNRADVLIQGLREFQAGCDGITTAPTAAVAMHPAGNGTGAGAEERPAPVRITKTPPRAGATKAVPRGTGKQAITVRKLGERPSLVPMARGDARLTNTTTPTPAALASVSQMIDKPTTVGKAMKVFIRAQMGGFTGEAVRTWLLADKDYAKLLQESSPGVVAANLVYSADAKYLTRVGEKPLEASYTVTATGKEWFAK